MHSNRSLLLGLLLLAGLGSPALKADSKFDPEDRSALFVTGTVGFQYDDNIFLRSHNVEGDCITTFTPGIEYAFGVNSLTEGTFSYKEALVCFSQETSQNSNLASIALNDTYDDGRTKGSVNASFNQYAQNSVYVREASSLVHTDVTDAAAQGEWRLSEKTAFAVGGAFDRTAYKQTGFVTYNQSSLPVDAYFGVTPKVDLSLDYRYRQNSLAGNYPSFQDNFLGVGARGDFTGKLSGRFDVGYTQRHSQSGSDQTLLGADSSFTYLLTPKTSINAGVTNDFSNTAIGTSEKDFSVTVGARTDFEGGLSASALVTYRDLRFRRSAVEERDHYWDGTVGIGYQASKYVSFQAGYTLRSNSSNDPVGFTDNVFSVSGSVRF